MKHNPATARPFAEPLESRRLFVVIATTLYPDADLSGQVITQDFTLLASRFDNSNPLWLSGDFNFDGAVNPQDLMTPVTRLLIPGDATSDGIVNTLDFTRVVSHLGNHTTSLKKGDVYHDGRVNSLDAALVFAEFGKK